MSRTDAVTMVAKARFHSFRVDARACFILGWRTCSLMRVQADELEGALVWRLAVFAVLDVFPPWTEPESVAVSNQEYLSTPNQRGAVSHKTKVLGITDISSLKECSPLFCLLPGYKRSLH